MAASPSDKNRRSRPRTAGRAAIHGQGDRLPRPARTRRAATKRRSRAQPGLRDGRAVPRPCAARADVRGASPQNRRRAGIAARRHQRILQFILLDPVSFWLFGLRQPPPSRRREVQIFLQKWAADAAQSPPAGQKKAPLASRRRGGVRAGLWASRRPAKTASQERRRGYKNSVRPLAVLGAASVRSLPGRAPLRWTMTPQRLTEPRPSGRRQ